MSKSSMSTLCSRPYNSFQTSGVCSSFKQQQSMAFAVSSIPHAIKNSKLHSTTNAASSSDLIDSKSKTEEAATVNKKFTANKSVWGARSSFNLKKYGENSIRSNNNNKIESRRTCAAHSNSPNSSGASLESIVPKYQKNGYTNSNGTKQNNMTKPQKRSYNTSSAFNKINNSLNTNRKIVTLTVEGRIAKKCKEKDAKDMRSPFSDKFPMGLPFEEEFYRPSNRSSSIYTTLSHNEGRSSCSSSLNYEDEFNRKPSCEPLYVDFSKTISADDIPDYRNENYYKFERVSKYYDGDAVIVREQPTVYLAVASWVPKCNQICFETKKMENTNKENLDGMSRRRRDRSKRSYNRRTSVISRRNEKYRQRADRSHSNLRKADKIERTPGHRKNDNDTDLGETMDDANSGSTKMINKPKSNSATDTNYDDDEDDDISIDDDFEYFNSFPYRGTVTPQYIPNITKSVSGTAINLAAKRNVIDDNQIRKNIVLNAAHTALNSNNSTSCSNIKNNSINGSQLSMINHDQGLCVSSGNLASDMYNTEIDYMNKYLKSLPDYKQLSETIHNSDNLMPPNYYGALSYGSRDSGGGIAAPLMKSNSYHFNNGTGHGSKKVTSNDWGSLFGENGNKITRSISGSILSKRIDHPDIKPFIPPRMPVTNSNNLSKSNSTKSVTSTRSAGKQFMNDFWMENANAKPTLPKSGWDFSKVKTKDSIKSNVASLHNIFKECENSRDSYNSSQQHEPVNYSKPTDTSFRTFLSQTDSKPIKNIPLSTSTSQILSHISTDKKLFPPLSKSISTSIVPSTGISASTTYTAHPVDYVTRRFESQNVPCITKSTSNGSFVMSKLPPEIPPRNICKSSSGSTLYAKPYGAIVKRKNSDSVSVTDSQGWKADVSYASQMISKNNEFLKSVPVNKTSQPQHPTCASNFFIKQTIPQANKVIVGYPPFTKSTNIQIPINGNLPSAFNKKPQQNLRYNLPNTQSSSSTASYEPLNLFRNTDKRTGNHISASNTDVNTDILKTFDPYYTPDTSNGRVYQKSQQLVSLQQAQTSSTNQHHAAAAAAAAAQTNMQMHHYENHLGKFIDNQIYNIGRAEPLSHKANQSGNTVHSIYHQHNTSHKQQSNTAVQANIHRASLTNSLICSIEVTH